MGDYHALKPGRFVDDQGVAHDMVPSAVIAGVPTAKAAAEHYGRMVHFDFLDDRAVHWILFQRREDTEKASALGCLLATYLVRRHALMDPTLRNMRSRVRLYRKIAGIARRGGADVPILYPYYGMYLSSRKFFPDAPERAVPAKEESV
ncbi:hypothetical protein [Streptomyces sp. NPDC003832]